MAALTERVRADSGGLDLLVNNVWAGYAAYHEDRHTDMEGAFWEQPLSVWDDMFTGGVRARYATTVLAVPLLRPGALIVTVSESPEFAGRAVAALAGDPGVARHTGRCLVAAELAEEYGFTDLGGTRPATARDHFRRRSGSS